MSVTAYSVVWGGYERRAFDRLEESAGFARSVLAQRLDQVTGEVTAMARAEAAAPAPADPGSARDGAAEGRLRQWMTDQDLDLAVLAEADGRVVASVRRPPELAPGADPPDDGQLLAGRGNDRALVTRTIVPGGDRVLVGGIWLDRVRLERIFRPPGVSLVVATRDGPVASTLAGGLAPPGPPEPDQSRSRVGGTAYYVVGTPLAGTAVTLLALSRPDTDTRTILILILAALFLILAVLIVLVGHAVSGVVTRPLGELARAAMAVSEGDLDRRVDEEGDREMAAMAAAFNRMTDNLRGYVRQLEETRNEFRLAIARLGDVLASTDDLPRIVEVVLETCALIVRAETAVFYERVAMPARVRSMVVHGGGDDEDPAIELSGDGVAGAAGLQLGPVVFPGPVELAAKEPDVAAAAAVPVIVESRLFGVIAVYGKAGGGEFTADDLDTLVTLARQGQVAIGNVMLHEETRRQARTDDLTGLWNRREFELRGREAVKEATRFSDPFGMMLVDIDDFREVNNNHSYLHGNAALVAVAARLSEATREVDFVARWGGEEFVVLLPRTGPAETGLVCERVRAAVGREAVVHDGAVMPLTVSIGYAVFPGDGATAEALFNAADAALKVAKKLGKNRVQQARANEGVP